MVRFEPVISVIHHVGRLAKRAFLAVGILAVLTLMVSPLRAAAVFWAGGGGDVNWATLGNWTNNTPPLDSTDQVNFLGNGTAAQGTVNNALVSSITVGSLSYQALMPASHATLIPQGVTLSVVGSRTTTIGNYSSTDALFAGTGLLVRFAITCLFYPPAWLDARARNTLP